MGWWATATGRARLVAKSGPHHHTYHHHHQHQHHHHRGVLSSGGACPSIRRSWYLLALSLLAGVLLLNMVLLGPRLLATAPSASGDGGGDDGSIGWEQADVPAAAAAAAAAGKAVRGAAGSGSRLDEQHHQQQRNIKQPQGDFLRDFDSDRDGLLGPAEFKTLAQEACRNDRSSLGPVSWLVRLLRLLVGLSPSYASAGSYPCSLQGELADAARQAAAAIGFGSKHSSKSGGSKGRSSRGLRDELRADMAAGAAVMDPDSAEGRAAARRAALLVRCSPVTPELAAAAASHGTVLLVAADWGMFELFGVNWLAHVQRSGVDNYLMVALDQKTANFLTSNKLGHCISWNPNVQGGGDGVLPVYSPPAASPGSKQHALLSWTVLQAAQVLLEWEYDVIISHLDTVWLTDPLPYVQAHVPAAADVVFCSEAPAPAAVMGSRSAGLSMQPDADSPVSTSVTFIRGTQQGQAAVSAWLDVHQHQREQVDAAAASGALAAGTRRILLPDEVVRGWLSGQGSSISGGRGAAVVMHQPHPVEPKALLLVGPRSGLWGRLFGSQQRRSQSAGVGVFTPVAVSSSYSWFVQGVGWRAAAVVARSSSSAASGRKLPLAVHVGAGHSSREGRLHQLRDAQWYADGPKYYSEPKLMTFELSAFNSPEVTAGLANAPDFSQAQLLVLHVASLRHQLQQFYAGAAVATSLGRVLVLPNFQCYCYRVADSAGAGSPLSWHSISPSSEAQQQGRWACRAPGDDNSVLPFNCTLEQVLDPAALYSHGAVFGGRPLLFREAPFLHNPRSPSWIRHSATTVSSGVPAGCVDDTPCAQVLQSRPPIGVNQQVIVQAGLTDNVLAEVLAPLSAAKLLHFTDIASVFGGFADASHKSEYEAWLDRVVLPWCCKVVGDSAGVADIGTNWEEGFDGMASSDLSSASHKAVLQDIVEIPTTDPRWAMVEIKARQG